MTQATCFLDMKVARTSPLPPLDEVFVSSSITTTACNIRAPVRILSFIRWYFVTSSTMSRNLTPEILPYQRGRWTYGMQWCSPYWWSRLISLYFLAFIMRCQRINLPVTTKTPQATAAISRSRTTGAAIILAHASSIYSHPCHGSCKQWCVNTIQAIHARR